MAHRRLTFFLCWVWLFASLATACGQARAPRNPAAVTVELLPLDIDPRDPNRTDFDRLRLLGAYELRSRDSRFGGLSGLALGADGKLYAVSDRGYWLSARMHLDAGGRLSHLSEWQIAPLLSPGRTPVGTELRDAEALARMPDGSFIVAFEQIHRVWRYPAPPATFSSAASPVKIPSDVAKAPSNGGLEALAALPDGRLLAITEALENPDGSLQAWLITNGRSEPLSYVPSDGFRPSDAAALPNGDVLVLERRYNLFLHFSATVKLVKAQALRAGAKIEGISMLRLDSPVIVDNFEGLAAMESPSGTMIFLVSDDNYLAFQRTLLLQFLLPHRGIE